MKTTHNLKHIITTKTKQGGKFNITISLDDDCKNGHCDFSITGMAWTLQGEEDFGGCCHEEILAVKPELKLFIDLHLSDANGMPMHAIANGFYHATNSSIETLMNYMRVNKIEAQQLIKAEDELRFAFIAHNIGLVNRWKAEAEKAILLLESWTGEKFKDVTPNGRGAIITISEIRKVSKLEKKGYYTPKKITERSNKAKQDTKNKIIADLKKNMQNEVTKAKNEYNVKMAVLACGIDIDNFIYYPYSNEGAFNWLSYGTKITENEFNKFLKNVNKKALPIGITFKMK